MGGGGWSEYMGGRDDIGTKEIFGVTDTLIILIVMMIS